MSRLATMSHAVAVAEHTGEEEEGGVAVHGEAFLANSLIALCRRHAT